MSKVSSNPKFGTVARIWPNP